MATDIYASPEPRTVKLFDTGVASPSVEWLYYFETKVKATDVSVLGQTPAATLPPDGAFICATDFPKPYKAKNKTTGVSSLCSADKVATARTSGWTITDGVFAAERKQETTTFEATQRGSVVVYVEALARPGGSATINYAWYLPRKVIAKATLAKIQELGIKFPTSAADWKSLVFGGGGGSGENTRGPRPARAQLTLRASGNVDRVTTFYAHGTTLPDHWKHVRNAIQFTG